MAQKLILCEGMFGKDLTKYPPLANALSDGYEITGVSGVVDNSNKPMCYVKLDTPSESASTPAVDKPAAPKFALTRTNGDSSVTLSLALSTTTASADIYYTTNGNTPTSESTKYTAAISLTDTTTIKAIAVKDGVASDVSELGFALVQDLPVESQEP